MDDGIPTLFTTLASTGPVNRIEMCDNNRPLERKRRDIEGSDELTHEDFEVLMTPLKSNEHHREKRSVVSKDNATRYCAERLLETRVGKLCAKLGANVQALVNVCSADIEVTFYQCLYCTQKEFETKFEFNNKIDDDYKTFTRRFDALKRHFQELYGNCYLAV